MVRISVYYDVYTEVKIKDSWHLIDPNIKNYKEEKLRLIPTYESSRSWFGETYDKLQYDTDSFNKIEQDDLSKELKIHFNIIDKENNEDAHDLFKRNLATVDYNEIFKMCHYMDSEVFMYHGFILKDRLVAFKSGDLDCLWPEELEEYCKLNKEERAKLYIYHEWDNADDWLYHFKKICGRVEYRLDDFYRANYYQTIEGIRLIIYRC